MPGEFPDPRLFCWSRVIGLDIDNPMIERLIPVQDDPNFDVMYITVKADVVNQPLMRCSVRLRLALSGWTTFGVCFKALPCAHVGVVLVESGAFGADAG